MTAAELAAIALVRTSAGTVALLDDSFEGEGECPECGHEGLLSFYVIDPETAVAECPECGGSAHKYLGQD